MKRLGKEPEPIVPFKPSPADLEGKPIVRTSQDFGPDSWASSVDGTCMEPVVMDGSIVVLSPSAPLVDGCIACIETHNGDRSLKRIYDAGPYYIARPDNPAFAPFLMHKSIVRFITRAVWAVPTLDGEPDEEAGYCLEAPLIRGGVKQILIVPLFKEPPRMSAGGVI